MASIKHLFQFIKYLAISVWGLTIVDIIPFLSSYFKIPFLDGFDGYIKTFMALAGAIYFVITIPHKLKMQKLERETKRLNNKMLAEEVEQKEIETEAEKKISINPLRLNPYIPMTAKA